MKFSKLELLSRKASGVLILTFFVSSFVALPTAVSQDVELVGKRLNEMVKKEQLTRTQADAMLAALLQLAAKNKSETTTPVFNNKAGSSKSLNSATPNEIMLDTKTEQIEEFFKEIARKRSQAQVKVKQFKAKAERAAEKQENLNRELAQLKNLLAEAEANGSVNRNGKEFTTEQLKSFTLSKVKQLKLIESNVEQKSEIDAALNEHLRVTAKEERMIAKRYGEIKTKHAKQESLRIAENAKRKTDNLDSTLSELDRLIEGEIKKFKTPRSIGKWPELRARVDERTDQLEPKEESAR